MLLTISFWCLIALHVIGIAGIAKVYGDEEPLNSSSSIVAWALVLGLWEAATSWFLFLRQDSHSWLSWLAVILLVGGNVASLFISLRRLGTQRYMTMRYATWILADGLLSMVALIILFLSF